MVLATMAISIMTLSIIILSILPGITTVTVKVLGITKLSIMTLTK
jgi:hypothetical protein